MPIYSHSIANNNTFILPSTSFGLPNRQLFSYIGGGGNGPGGGDLFGGFRGSLVTYTDPSYLAYATLFSKVFDTIQKYAAWLYREKYNLIESWVSHPKLQEKHKVTKRSFDPIGDVLTGSQFFATQQVYACRHAHFFSSRTVPPQYKLISAIFNNDEKLLYKALKEGANPFANYMKNLMSPIFLASKLQKWNLVLAMWEATLSPINMHLTPRGATPLMLAIKTKNEALIERLLKAPEIDVNLADKEGQTPLMYACWSGNLKAVEKLLAHSKIKYNEKSQQNQTALTLVLQAPIDPLIKRKIALALLEKEDLEVNGFTVPDISTPLHLAIETKDLEIVKSLLGTQRVDINFVYGSSAMTALHAAVSIEGAMVEELLKCPEIDVNASNFLGQTALHIACEMQKTEIVEILLKHPKVGVNYHDNSGLTPFHLVMMEEEFLDDIIYLFLNHPDFDSNAEVLEEGAYFGSTPLLFAIYKNYQDLFECLYMHPQIDVNKAHRITFDTPLHVAVKYQREGMLKFLTKRSEIDLTALNHLLETPLMLATKIKNEQLAKNHVDQTMMDAVQSIIQILKNAIYPAIG